MCAASRVPSLPVTNKGALDKVVATEAMVVEEDNKELSAAATLIKKGGSSSFSSIDRALIGHVLCSWCHAVETGSGARGL